MDVVPTKLFMFTKLNKTKGAIFESTINTSQTSTTRTVCDQPRNPRKEEKHAFSGENYFKFELIKSEDHMETPSGKEN